MADNKITALGISFDATSVAPSVPMEPVPAGLYPVVITDAEIKVNDGGEGRRFVATWTVLEGQYKGRKVFDGFNYIHSNPQAQEIGQRDLSAICHAVNVLQLSDVMQLTNKPHTIQVDIEPARHVDADGATVETPVANGKTYGAKNRFKGAKAYTAAPAAKAAPTPAWAVGKPAAAAPQPAPAAAVATAPAKRKPGRPPKAPAAAPAPAPERKFWVNLDGDEFATPIPESQVVEYLAKGMPEDTAILLEGEDDWKDAAAYGIKVPGPASAAPAPVPTPAPAPVPVVKPAGNPPPWVK